MQTARAISAACLAAALLAPACGLLHRRARPPEVLDLNHASRRRLEALPGITPSMAGRIIDGRPYDSPDDLVTRGILTERELRRIDDRVTVKRESR